MPVKPPELFQPDGRADGAKLPLRRHRHRGDFALTRAFARQKINTWATPGSI
jgi:hypothetical protein